MKKVLSVLIAVTVLIMSLCTGVFAKSGYNIGEETYYFENFSDWHSEGHCFGMTVTSSLYYLDLLPYQLFGISSTDEINDLSPNIFTKAPICYFQWRQGSDSFASLVAGNEESDFYMTDPEADWNDCMNYVRSGAYDNTGELAVLFWDSYFGGHAVNFIRYDRIDGEECMVVYDNNFPDIESYLRLGSDGYIHESPYETFEGFNVDVISLMDIPAFYEKVQKNPLNFSFYAPADTIAIENAKAYRTVDNDEESYVFEISTMLPSVVITPLVEDATFWFMNQEYTFTNMYPVMFDLTNEKTSAFTIDIIFQTISGSSDVIYLEGDPDIKPVETTEKETSPANGDSKKSDPAEPRDETKGTEKKIDGDTVYIIISVASVAVIIIAIVALILILRKKKQ